MFLGGDNHTLLLMQKEPLSRGTQDADTAVFEMEVCPRVSGVSRPLGEKENVQAFSFSPLAGVTGANRRW